MAWATWRLTVGLALAVLAARIAYLIWLCPYELAADEAQYWDWSRRLDWSYYSKGPGVAWAIAASTGLFGAVEWAVRLPAAVASCVAALAIARLAARLCGGDERVGFASALLYQLAPIFYATSQFMTIDAPYFACWILAAAAGWRIVEGRRRAADWLLLGAALGAGVLFKYTMLLLLPGVLAYLWRREVGLGGRQKAIGAGLTVLALLAVASPVGIWNVRNGWPTLAHLIGNVGLPGGDVAPRAHWVWNPVWTLGYLFYPIVVLGPAVGVVLLRGWRDARSAPAAPLRPCWSYGLHTVAPLAIFYLAVSFATDIELNWAAAGYSLLLVPAAAWLVDGDGMALGRRTAWRWTLAVGVVCALAVSFGRWPMERLARASIGGRRLPEPGLLARVTGHRAWAGRVAEFAGDVKSETGMDPFFVGKNHAYAALLAFYLPSQPRVYSAGHLFGGRESSYDYFRDTSLADPALLGRPAIMVGAQAWHWPRALYVEDVRRAPVEGRIFAGYRYGGPVREPHMR